MGFLVLGLSQPRQPEMSSSWIIEAVRESQHYSRTGENGSHLPKGNISLPSGRRDEQVDVCGICYCWQYTQCHKCLSPVLASWLFSHLQANLLNTPVCSLYGGRFPWPLQESLLSWIALVMSSLFPFLSTLDSSRCLWAFSLSYSQYKPSP